MTIQDNQAGGVKLEAAICEALLNAFPMDDKVAAAHAAVATKVALASLPISEAVPAQKSGQRTVDDGAHADDPGHAPELMRVIAEAAVNVAERHPDLRGPWRFDEDELQDLAVRARKYLGAAASPSKPSEAMVERAARAQCVEGGFNPDEIMANDGPRWRYYVPGVRVALTAALSGGGL